MNKERPILFSGAMVRAIIDGRKTQTRRTVKPKPPAEATSAGVFTAPGKEHHGRWQWLSGEPRDCDTWECLGDGFRCPYGEPDDRLWVKETFHREQHPEEIGLTQADIPHFWAMAVAKAGTYLYRADPAAEIAIDGRPWTPSIYMPRKASRLLLDITEVRVERLQDISEPDAEAEGIHKVDIGSGYGSKFGALPFTWAEAVEQQADCHDSARAAYRDLWESINGPGSWAANPWVWVITFTRAAP